MRLADKVAVVTGGGTGIGRAISLRFGAEGAKVVVAEIQEQSAERTRDEINAAGGEAIAVSTDVTDPSRVEALVSACDDRYNRIDVLVNNAGVTGVHHPHLFAPFLELDLEAWRKVIDINLTSLFICGQAVGRYMVERKIEGRMINIGSITSFGAEKISPNYSASKHGVLGLTRAMAVELSPFKIIVNAIAPGMTGTEGAIPRLTRDPLRTGIEKGVPPWDGWASRRRSLPSPSSWHLTSAATSPEPPSSWMEDFWPTSGGIERECLNVAGCWFFSLKTQPPD